jgi:5-formyltetrahydrofolate cyclo-ligase
MEVRMTKAQIRIKMKERRDGLSIEEQKTGSAAISKRLYAMKEFAGCEDLFIYASFKSEVNTQAVVERAFAKQKRVFVPIIESWKECGINIMNFYRIYSLNSLKPNKIGIPEPVKHSKKPYKITEHSIKSIPLMLLPGLAFDLSGNRVGYGGGYYDSYLNMENPKLYVKAALAYDFQIVTRIVRDIYDVKMDFIITPTKIIACG